MTTIHLPGDGWTEHSPGLFVRYGDDARGHTDAAECITCWRWFHATQMRSPAGDGYECPECGDQDALDAQVADALSSVEPTPRLENVDRVSQ